MQYLAAYKGPASGLFNIVFHKAVCLITNSKYSHCELVIDGVAYSASARDGGVRKKNIDFSSGKWDLYPIQIDSKYVKAFYSETENDSYDYLGLGYFILPWIRGVKNRWFCSEWCATAIRLPKPSTMHIQSIVDAIK